MHFCEEIFHYILLQLKQFASIQPNFSIPVVYRAVTRVCVHHHVTQPHKMYRIVM